MSDIKYIALIGAGKVGSALAPLLLKHGYSINKIISASGLSASNLATEIGCAHGTGYDIPGNTDLVIIAVPDDSINMVVSELEAGNDVIVVHTAGSYGTEVFIKQSVAKFGVLYPLQSFTPGRIKSLENVPIFIEADSVSTLAVIRDFATSLSSKVVDINAENRIHLHVAAVFVSNFVNFMLTAADELAGRAGIDFSLFEPLAQETLEKAFAIGPANAQTGPAARNDRSTIEKHMELLSYNPDLKTLYETITKSIINSQKTKKR
jgi:predicted short-subunit dehydrogenase-like oxidoreductase (DUF2520 family)